MADVPRAMISSTTLDLPDHRRMAQDACLRQDFFPTMMEHLPPSPDDAVQLSMALVAAADVYVLVLGLRYGEVPAGHDKSYTHLEYDRAVVRGIPIIVMLSSDDHPFRGGDVERGPGAERIDQLRAEVRGRGYALFSGPDDLRAQLIHGLGAVKPRLSRARAASPHYVHQPDPPPAPYIAHPYTLLEAGGVVGRKAELDVLTDWVSDPATPVHAARLLVLVAIGGMGKSALTWRWFHEIAPYEMPGLAGRVWWSFYESDATFANFVLRTLAYVTGRPMDELREMRSSEREDALIAVLDREEHLIVLDGLERLLLAYTRPDAARLADDDLDEQTANYVAEAKGLPASAAASYTGQTRLRLTADTRVGSFLRRLVKVRAARILVTSRLFPAELQSSTTSAPIPGAGAYFLRGLAPADAVQLWRGFGCGGSRGELAELFASFDYYPLLVRALAGEVARFRRAPGDLAAWRAAHPDFDPFTLPLVQRKSHVLQYALQGLTGADLRILQTIAAFRAPTSYDVLAALLAGPDRACADEGALDRALAELEDRGLLGWDRRSNRYDLHPVVRGVAWAQLDDDGRHGIDLSLAAHFESIPPVDDDAITSLDDLATPIEWFHTLLRLGRIKEAMELLGDRLFNRLASLGAFRDAADLAAAFVGEVAKLAPIADEPERHEQVATALLLAGFSHTFSADPVRAALAYENARPSVDRALADDDRERSLTNRFVDGLCALPSYQAGRLADAERQAYRGVDAVIEIDDLADVAVGVLGLVRAIQGREAESRAWLTDYRLGSGADIFSPFTLVALARHALAVPDERVVAATLDAMADQAKDFGVHTDARLGLVQGLDALRRGDPGQAADLLGDALTLARTAGMAEIEVTVRLELARWYRGTGRTEAALEHVDAGVELAERATLRLLHADLLVVRCDLALDVDDRVTAAGAAQAAFQLAWCDGPPWCYALCLREARSRLAAAGVDEPRLASTAGPMNRVPGFRPTPSLRSDDAVFREFAWPVRSDRPADPVRAVAESGWTAAEDAAVAALAADLIDSDGHAVADRLAAVSFPPAERIEVARWLAHGRFAEAEAMFVELLHAGDADIAHSALAQLRVGLDPEVQKLLSVDLDGVAPWLDPTAPIPAAHVDRVVERFGDQGRSDLHDLAVRYGMDVEAGTGPSG